MGIPLKKKEIIYSSNNIGRYSEIRKFMDVSSRAYINQKKETDIDRLKTQVYTHLANVKNDSIGLGGFLDWNSTISYNLLFIAFWRI